MTLGHASLNALRRKRSVKGVVRLKVPRTVKSGSYFLLGCVEHVRAAAGRRAARAACRAARGRVVIAAVGSIPTSLPGITPNPRGVTPHLDVAHATSGTVTPNGGGTLTTTGADGTHYRLDVPAGAVLSPLAVTMTPLSSVDGLGMSGGLVGGVQMGPDGLQLLEPAKLTITPHPGAPTTRLTAFAYHGNGANLGLVPLDPGGLSFELMHFSGDGVGSASAADRAAQYAHAPAGTLDQFRQEAQRLQGDHQGTLALFNTYYTQVLKPTLEAALDDETLAPGAVVAALSALRQMEILGYDVSATRAEVFQLIINILKNAFNRAYDRCVNQHNPAEVQNLIADLRALALRGAEGQVDASKVGKCVQFKLDYTGDFTDNAKGSTIQGEDLGVESLQAQLSYNSSTGTLEADLPLTITHITDYNYLCVANGDTGTARPPRPRLGDDRAQHHQRGPGRPHDRHLRPRRSTSCSTARRSRSPRQAQAVAATTCPTTTTPACSGPTSGPSSRAAAPLGGR